MIKINLANKKTASYVGGGQGAAPGLDLSDLKKNLNLAAIKELGLHKIIAAVLVIGAGYILVEQQKGMELGKADQQESRLKITHTRLEAELKTKQSYKKRKADLEKNEFLIRKKIETIETLIAKRSYSPNLLVLFSEVIPEEIWLDQLTIDDKTLRMDGHALSYDFVSDFIRALENSVYLKGLTLSTTDQVRDTGGMDIVKFSLQAEKE